ncbi:MULTISPECIES: histidine phosphatase family protein [unclassified Leifsonia]|uniref:histidine phosphatase family protein n=1 Tax=unclassified Leifsonia TaxID=2663824 RepID=UPI0008A812B0|nr:MULTISPECIES: histidine phosphatase family protein [unclassified Leifsonia]SEH72280.1 Broad specificity phosphatase PhoE [Leifsonia sp. CL154]SFL33621.1 Broad specificity phosphatase PhoE [Leifsonia sp. CL147]
MTARTLLLIRHGESTANVAAAAAEAANVDVIPVEARDADVTLSSLGELQAGALGARLRDVLPRDAVVYSSPYRRAVETAQLALGADVILRIDERLRDRELGILDRLTAVGVERRLPLEAERRRWTGKFYYRPPGGEAWTDVALRLRSFLRDVPGDPDGTVVVFAHDAVVSLFLYVMLRMTEAQLAEHLLTHPIANASITELRFDGRDWSLHTFADDAHLAAAGLPATEHPGEARADA